MIKIGLTLLCINSISAKLYKSDIDLDGDPKSIPNFKSNVWVLRLNDDSFNFNSLMLANNEEQNIFQSIVLPTIKKIQDDEKAANYFSQTTRSEHNNIDDENENSSIKEIKSKLLSAINKLFMIHSDDLDNQRELTNHKKSLQIYFSRPFSSLILRAGHNMYQYFINQPSPLPNWFYMEHRNIKKDKDTIYVDIPKDVQEEFLKSFLYFLNMVLSFPM